MLCFPPDEIIKYIYYFLVEFFCFSRGKDLKNRYEKMFLPIVNSETAQKKHLKRTIF